MAKRPKDKKWFNPMSELEEEFDKEMEPEPVKKKSKSTDTTTTEHSNLNRKKILPMSNMQGKNWMKNFDPVTVQDLAVNNKKVQEVEQWIQLVSCKSNSDVLLLTGPVGSGKTATIRKLADKHNFKISEWITPLDIDLPSEHGDFEYKEKQSTKFLEFILSAANFTSLLDNNSNKLVLVEDFPNTFLRSPPEFTEVLHQYQHRAKSPIVFICSDSNSDKRNTASNLFTPALKDQFGITHIVFNGASVTCLKAALKRVADIISKNYVSVYNIPSTELMDCVVNSSAGDIRSAVLNLHFACLKGSNQSLETSVLIEKEKPKKTVRTRKKPSSKFTSIGKDQTVTILHGVGRALNPKVLEVNSKLQFTHPPSEVIEQFVSQPSSFVNFLEENYLAHFSTIDDTQKAAAALSDADIYLAQWGEQYCQEYGLYVATAGLMVANTAPVSAWNPVRGPKSMKVQYPSPIEMPMLEPNNLYKGKILATDFKSYCDIIAKS